MAPDVAVRALRVLETLAGMAQPAGLPAVTAASGLPKITVYRALRALQDDGFVDHIGRDGYQLGGRAISLASLMRPRPALLRSARPILSKLAVQVGATTGLFLRAGSHRVLVLGAEPGYVTLPEPIPVGERAPLTSGCSGVAILAHLPIAEADAIIDARRPGEHRQTAAQLAQIRADGFAISRSANHIGMNGVAAPLLDPADGVPLGSIAVAADEQRLPPEVVVTVAGPLRAACNDLALPLAALLGRHSVTRHDALDVTIRDIVDYQSPTPRK